MNRTRYKKKIISAAALFCFMAVLAIGSDLSPKICQIYLQVSGADEGEQMVSLWNVNEGAVHKYIIFGEEDIAVFNLTGKDVWHVDQLEIVLDGYERDMKVHAMAILTDKERLDYGPQNILEKFEIGGANDWEIQDDGLLHISTGNGVWNLKGSKEFCMELNRIRGK